MSPRAECEERGRHWLYLLAESRLCFCPERGKVWDNPNHTPTGAAGQAEGWGQGEAAGNPAMAAEWEQERSSERSQPLAARSSPGLTH